MWLREVLAVAWERPAGGFGAFGSRQTAGLNALQNRWLGHVAARGVATCLGKACGRVWSVRGRANGRLERPSKQMAGGCGCESRCQLPWPAELGCHCCRGKRRKSHVPHLRWSQAPPRPQRRPGSADTQ